MSEEKLLAHPKALCNQVKRIAVKAGEMIMEYFEEFDRTDIIDKSDGSPVTQADRSAEALIEKELFNLTPTTLSRRCVESPHGSALRRGTPAGSI